MKNFELYFSQINDMIACYNTRENSKIYANILTKSDQIRIYSDCLMFYHNFTNMIIVYCQRNSLNFAVCCENNKLYFNIL